MRVLKTSMALAALSASIVAGAAGPAASYSADPQQSRLEFTGVQAGADFKGSFHKFTEIGRAHV